MKQNVIIEKTPTFSSVYQTKYLYGVGFARSHLAFSAFFIKKLLALLKSFPKTIKLF
jgi:hypothetical protein